jgi:hypothetical protein
MSSDSLKKLFPQLLRHGYIPLPNRDKACMLPKWSTILVDERQAHLWTRQSRWPAIGLRVEPPLLVLDFDLPDPAIAAAIRGIIPKVVLEQALERVGSPPKTAFFLRMVNDDDTDLFREAHTRRFHFAAQPKPAFAVQAFAGGGGAAQFGAFGPHSHDDRGVVLKTYSWVGGRSPATVPLADLPELTRAEVFDLLDAADALLMEWPGLVIDESTHKGPGRHNVDYLDDDMVYRDADGSEYTFEELTAEAKARHELKQPELRITGSFTGDTSSSGSPRCKVHWSKTKGVSIVDFKTGTTWRMIANADDPELHKLLDEIFGNKKKFGG